MEQRFGFGTIYLRRACPSDLNLYQYDDIVEFCGSTDNNLLCREMVNGNSGTCLIIENGLLTPVGYITIFTAPLIKNTIKANWLQYAIEPIYRNCGYATEAVAAVVEINRGILPIALLINDGNLSSIEVAKKCGFSKVDFFVNGIKHNGERINDEHCWLIE